MSAANPGHGFLERPGGTCLRNHHQQGIVVVDPWLTLSDADLSSSIAAAKASIDYDFLCEGSRQLIAESRSGLERVKRIVQDLKDFSRVDESELQWSDIEKCLDSTRAVVANNFGGGIAIVKAYAGSRLRAAAERPPQLLVVRFTLGLPKRTAVAEVSIADDASQGRRSCFDR